MTDKDTREKARVLSETLQEIVSRSPYLQEK